MADISLYISLGGLPAALNIAFARQIADASPDHTRPAIAAPGDARPIQTRLPRMAVLLPYPATCSSSSSADPAGPSHHPGPGCPPPNPTRQKCIPALAQLSTFATLVR